MFLYQTNRVRPMSEVDLTTVYTTKYSVIHNKIDLMFGVDHNANKSVTCDSPFRTFILPIGDIHI